MTGGSLHLDSNIGQGGMADDWWQSAPEKNAAPPFFRWKSAGKKCGDLSDILNIASLAYTSISGSTHNVWLAEMLVF